MSLAFFARSWRAFVWPCGRRAPDRWVVKLGELEIDFDRRRVTVNGSEVHLTPTEWDLMPLFATHPDKVLTDRMITEAVCGASYAAQAHSLHVYVGRLRKKLEASDGARRHLVTDPGVGYRLLTDGTYRTS